MEVTHVRDHVTHAVIAPNQAIDFGISDSPEFFHILSSTLYTNQRLAVIRETLCNAWDAHIEAGCTDRAVQVTLNDSELIIRDYGTGISDDDMGPIYGVYGGSTKKKNKDVTGGFGLGCKAPFAYTDHFDVESFHGGRRTLYKLSKSSAEVNGRPGITPIASFPTDETGLKVSIKLTERPHRHEFAQLIRRIVANGDMRVDLNGDRLPVLPFSTMPHGFMITSVQNVIDSDHRVCIRYGNVVYPVERHEDFRDHYDYIQKFLTNLSEDRWGSRVCNHRLILQAAPNTISVTPSRESLSMQAHTITTLTQLMSDFVRLVQDRLQPECEAILQDSIKETWEAKRVRDLFSTIVTIPGLGRSPRATTTFVELRPAVELYASLRYPAWLRFRHLDLMCRLDTLIDGNFGNTGLLKAFRSELIRRHRRRNMPGLYAQDIATAFFQKKIVWPLIRDLKEAGLKADRLWVSRDATGGRYGEPLHIEAKRHTVADLTNCLPFLRNIVVLAHNRQDLDRVSSFPIMKKLGQATNFLVYTVARNSNKADEARAFFEARNVELIDLTVYHEWEQHLVPKKVEKAPVVVKSKGLPQLTSLINGGIRMEFLDEPDAKHDIQRLIKPKIVVKISRAGELKHHLPNFGSAATRAIIELWGHKIGVAVSSSQEAKYVKEGSVSLETWLFQEVLPKVRQSKAIRLAVSSDYARLGSRSNHLNDLMFVIWQDAELLKSFGIVNKMTAEDILYYKIWRSLERWDLKAHPAIKEVWDDFATIEVNPKVTALYQKMQERKLLLSAVDDEGLSDALLAADPKTRELARKIIITALKG